MDGCISIYGYFLICVFSVLVRVGDSTTVVTTNVTYAVNSSVFVKCVVSNVNQSLWSLRRYNEDTTRTITSGVTAFRNETYLNITSIPSTDLSTYDLIIPRVSVELEGQYDCREKGTEITSVYITVEDSTTVVTTTVTYAVNSSVFIKCMVSNVNLSLWSFRRYNEDTTRPIISGVTAFKNETYLNITSIPPTELSTYDLIIPHLSLELDGQYDCREKGKIIKSVYIIVEVPPVVLLKIDGNTVNGTIHAEAHKELSIQCVAVGGHPAVSLNWQVDDQMLSTDVTTRTREDGTVVSDLIYRPQRENKVIKCSTTGQIAIPNVTVEANFNILYKPVCYSQLINTTDDGLFICDCSANPTPNVSILANDILLSNQRTMVLTLRHPVNLSCLSSNYLGTVQTNNRLFLPRFKDDSHIDDETSTPSDAGKYNKTIFIGSASVGLLVVVLSLLFVYQCCIKRWKHARSFNLQAIQRETNLQPHTWATMSDRPPQPTPQKQNRVNAYSYAKEPHFDAETTMMCDSSDTFLSKSPSAKGSTYNICYHTNKQQVIGYNARESSGCHKYETMPSLEVEHNFSESTQERPTSHAYHVLEKETVDTSGNDQQNSAAFIATQSEEICETDIKADDLTRSQDDEPSVSTSFDDLETSSSQDTIQPQSPSNEPSYCQDTEIPLYDDPPLD